MFDGLMRSKFSNKCKSKLKCIKLRIGPLRGKKEAMVRIQKKDVAELIAGGHQENAFGRIDALSTDMNLLRCYEMIEQCCESIHSQLPILQKQRECPDELAEAMSTLVYAAARFPDLPELCDLRHIFIDRYSSTIESCVNAEFMKKIQKNSLSINEKLQVMQGIAEEFSVRWNLKEFDQKSCNPPVPNPAVKKSVSVPKDEESLQDLGIPKREVQSMLKGKPVSPNIEKRQLQVQNGIHVVSSINKGHSTDPIEHVHQNHMKTAVPPYMNTRRKEKSALKSDNLDGDVDILYNKIPKVHKKDKSNAVLEHEKLVNSSSNDKLINSVPPYAKPNRPKNRYHVEEIIDNEIAPYSRPKYQMEEKNRDGLALEEVRIVQNKGRVINMIPSYAKPRRDDLTAQSDPRFEAGNLKNTEIGSSHDDKTLDDERPMSVRRTVRNPTVLNTESIDVIDDGKLTGYILEGKNKRENTLRNKEKMTDRETRATTEHEEDNAIYYGKLLSRISSEQRRHGRYHSVATREEEYNEDEMVIDRLLAHYSKKGTSQGPNKDRTRTKKPAQCRVVCADSVADNKYHVRTPSVPLELASKKEVDRVTKRTTSLQPDARGSQVHAGIPDFDQLAARIAAMKNL